MPKTKQQKVRANNRNNKKKKVRQGLLQKHAAPSKAPVEYESPSSDSDGDPCDADSLQRLLEPLSKEKLISFLLDAVAVDPLVLPRVRAIADRDVSHRKIFVHGLSWDSNRDTLRELFSPFGPVEDCNVVMDRTCRCKGFGFVLFQSRVGAVKALKDPQTRLKNRLVSWQLASAGPITVGGSSSVDFGGIRKIYVTNVQSDVSPEKLRAFFERFGEVEAGPLGFEMLAGRPRGFVVFVYKFPDGARKALEEPFKMFEGHQLHCHHKNDRNEGEEKDKSHSVFLNPAVQQPLMLAAVAAQNLAMLGQSSSYGAMLAANPMLAAAALNPALNPVLSQALGAAGISGAGPPPLLAGSYGFPGVTSQLPGTSYGSPWSAMQLQGLQGSQSYQGNQMGSSAAGMLSQGVLGGFPS